MLNQDLHIHTTYSYGDTAVRPEQTLDLIQRIKHAKTVGISDHFEYIHDRFETYAEDVKKHGFRVGTEVNGWEWGERALDIPNEYYVYHCYDTDNDYAMLDRFLETEKPTIIAHANAMNTDLSRVPEECIVEINNRYIWRNDWMEFYGPYTDKFRFILSSDAHQPNWLGQSAAINAMAELGITETLLF